MVVQWDLKGVDQEELYMQPNLPALSKNLEKIIQIWHNGCEKQGLPETAEDYYPGSQEGLLEEGLGGCSTIYI